MRTIALKETSKALRLGSTVLRVTPSVLRDFISPKGLRLSGTTRRGRVRVLVREMRKAVQDARGRKSVTFTLEAQHNRVERRRYTFAAHATKIAGAVVIAIGLVRMSDLRNNNQARGTYGNTSPIVFYE